LLVLLIIAIDSRNFDEALEVFGNFLEGWLKILAVTTPGSIKLD
jgi:hypothetical protein